MQYTYVAAYTGIPVPSLLARHKCCDYNTIWRLYCPLKIHCNTVNLYGRVNSEATLCAMYSTFCAINSVLGKLANISGCMHGYIAL